MSLDLPRIIDSIHRDKGIPKDTLLDAIQTALLNATRKHYPEAETLNVEIDPVSGKITATKDGEKIDPAELGRIAAQTAKQTIIQRIREAERDTLFTEFEAQRGELITGTVQRFEGGAILVNLGKTDALLPRGEQIPGESHHPGERIRAVVLEVRKQGQRVKIILSRTHPDFVRRLFELEIPEIADSTIAIRALAREAGYRSKVAVASIDTKVDAVGACVGVRGTRIKNIVDELGGERIDIVRWNESLQVLIPNALQPAEIDEVMLCHLMGRAIVLVREDQLSLAIGRRGQNVRLASKLVGWDIEIMTSEELDEAIDRAFTDFTKIEGVTGELAEKLVEQGILSFDDLSVMEIDDLVATIEELDEDTAATIVSRAEELAAEQGDEGPRRKGGKGAAAAALAAAEAENEAAEAEAAAETEGEGEPEALADAPYDTDVTDEAAESEEDPSSEGAIEEAVDSIEEIDQGAEASYPEGMAEGEAASPADEGLLHGDSPAIPEGHRDERTSTAGEPGPEDTEMTEP